MRIDNTSNVIVYILHIVYILDAVARFTTPLTLNLYCHIRKNLFMFVHVMYHVVHANLLTQTYLLHSYSCNPEIRSQKHMLVQLFEWLDLSWSRNNYPLTNQDVWDLGNFGIQELFLDKSSYLIICITHHHKVRSIIISPDAKLRDP